MGGAEATTAVRSSLVVKARTPPSIILEYSWYIRDDC